MLKPALNTCDLWSSRWCCIKNCQQKKSLHCPFSLKKLALCASNQRQKSILLAAARPETRICDCVPWQRSLRLKSTTCHLQDDIFSGDLGVFHQDDTLYMVQRHGWGRRVHQSSPGLYPVESVRRLLKWKINLCRLLFHTLFHFSCNLQQVNRFMLVSITPECLFKCWEKDWQLYKVLKAFPSQLFLECFADLKCKIRCILTIKVNKEKD